MSTDAVDPGFRRHPARLLVVVGLAMTIVGSLLPWIAGAEFTGRPFALSGLDRTANGAFLILGAAALTWLVMNATAAEARLGIVRALPLLVAVFLVGAVNWSYYDARFILDEAISEGSTVSLEPGIWIAFSGALLCALGAVWLTVLDLRRRGGWFARADLARLLRPAAVAPALGLIVGALAGFVVTIWVAVRLFPSPAASFFYLVLGLTGLFLGGTAGRWLGDLLGRMASPPPRVPRRR